MAAYVAMNFNTTTTPKADKPKVVKTTRNWMAEATNAMEKALENISEPAVQELIQAALIAGLRAQNAVLRNS